MNQSSTEISSSVLNDSITRRSLISRCKMLAGVTLAMPTILTACNVIPRNSSDKTLRVYWSTGHAYNAYKNCVEQFKQKHQDWKIDFETYQWPDMQEKLQADFAAKTPPDLVEGPGQWIQQFGYEGKLLSLQSYIHTDGSKMGFPDDWQPYALSRNIVNGEFQGIQLHLTCELLFYNRDLLHQIGATNPPTNWDEFLAMTKALTRNNNYGFAAYLDPWPWLLQNGVHFYDATKNIVPMDNEDTYQALQFQTDLVYKYKVSPVPTTDGSSTIAQRLFSSQRAAFFMSGPWDIKPILADNPNFRWGITQALKEKVQATPVSSTSLFIPKEAKNPDMAWELLKRLVSLETEIAVTKEAYITMPRKSWTTDPQIQSLDLITPFTKAFSYAQSIPGDLDRTSHAGVIIDQFNKAYQDIMYQQKPIPETIKEFVVSANTILDKR